jgi:hypothetical protein
VSREILVAVVVTLIVDEATGLSRWCATKLARWAAKHIYLADVERTKKRSEEWDALISKSIPTNIAALCFGLSLGAAAVACMVGRRAAVVVSAFSRLCAMPPGVRLAERDERRATEQRQASVALLRAASELRLLVTDAASSSPDQLRANLREIRSQAVNTELQAANVALVAPDTLAMSAGQLAETARRLADAAQNLGGDVGLTTRILDCAELDESMKTFLWSAVAASRGLADSDAFPVPGQVRRSDDDP